MTIAALRYNNPGNVSLPISGYSGPGKIVGIAGQSGYASFPTMADGYNAFQARLQSRISEGYDTISSLNTVYAQDPNWGASVASLSGIPADATLDPNNSAQMSALSSGIVQQETGMSPADLGINGSNLDGGSGGSIGVLTGPTSTAADGTVYDNATGEVISSPYGSVDSSAFAGSGLDHGGGPYDAAGVVNLAPQELGPQSPQPGGASYTGAGGQPVFVTDASNTGQIAGQAVSSGVQSASATLSKQIDASTKAGVAAGTSWFSSIEQAATDLAIRFGLILIAVALLAGAWVFFSAESKGNGETKIIPVPL